MGEIPEKKTPSYPANFSSGPHVPPEFESAQASVSGLCHHGEASAAVDTGRGKGHPS